jgi:Rod binding domain-containing protein
MSDISTPPLLNQPAIPAPLRTADTPAKIHDAAQQFEALLIGQILQSVSESGGWLGSGGDSASSCATGFAQEQLASVMARSGGFGLAGLIAKGLERGR